MKRKIRFKKIAIIGVGLIGSSFALSLRKKGYKGKITGIGRRKRNLVRAVDRGIIDGFSTNHAEGVRDADLVMLATSVGQFQQIIKDIRHVLRPGTVVTDVGSVKSKIVQTIEPLMPEGVVFIGGHPIAGKECPGIDAATGDLFNKALCIITPGKGADKKSLQCVIDLWDYVGTRTVVMSACEHDRIFAVVSHLPHVTAYTLITTILDSNKDILPYGGRGLKDMTRVALSPADLWRDICAYNRTEILRILRKYSRSISHVIDLFEKSDWSGLEKEFIRAKEARQLIESD